MSKSDLCDYSNAYLLLQETITIIGERACASAKATNRKNKQVIIKNCATIADCVSEINNAQVDNAKDLAIVMPMYNLIECSDDYANTSGSLRQYCRNEPDDDITDSKSFKFKSRFKNNTDNISTVNLQ